MFKGGFIYDKVIIGNDLPALVYAHLTCSPLLYTEFNKPKRYEFYDSSVNLDPLLIKNVNFVNTVKRRKKVGPSKWELYERLLWIHSISGFTPFSDNLSKIDVDEERIKIITKTSSVYRIFYKKAVLFEDTPNIFINFDVVKVSKKFINVYDSFLLENDLFPNKPNYFLIEIKEKNSGFVRNIHILKRRNDGMRHVTVHSFISKKNLASESCSPISVKMVLKNIFGKLLKINSNLLAKTLEIDHISRQSGCEGMPIYNRTKKIEFFYMTVPRILQRYDYVPCNPLKEANKYVSYFQTHRKK